ncbi:MAG: hypothetical protein ACJ72N_23990 [Labedaea sp.]
MTRALVITTAIVLVQWVVIARFPDPKWVLLALAVPAFLVGLVVSGVVAVVGRRGSGRR